jgi:cytochrome c oxidase subunit I
VVLTPAGPSTLLTAAPIRTDTSSQWPLEFLSPGFFNPALGGDPLLFQHLFWFYSHPAVYIMILPGMGVVSELIPCFSRKPLFGYKFVAAASLSIGVLGFWSGVITCSSAANPFMQG